MEDEQTMEASLATYKSQVCCFVIPYHISMYNFCIGK